jgi:hypothetical protein
VLPLMSANMMAQLVFRMDGLDRYFSPLIIALKGGGTQHF